MLMGRATYELFARLWGSPTDPYTQALHDVDKYVFSSTLERVDWHGTRLVRGGVTETVRGLRAAGGGDLLVYGHGGVARELLSAGLVDRLRLWVFPVLVGAGERLSDAGLRQPLELVGTEQLEHGVVVHTYRPGPVTG
jgi:dihydrofolate reductase